MRDTREHDQPPLTAVPDRLQAALAGRYAIERELGRGGMAVVYLAHDLKHHRHVAVKVLHPDLTGALGGERFVREIRIAARLQHPHILPVHDSGEAEGLLYYVMPYVAGESLRDRLTRERQLPIHEALRIAHEVADGLAYAHAHGIVHRDIKPENILLSGEHALVADFGIAHAVSAARGGALTLTGGAVGTPAYMSPEQASGDEAVDGRSDVYSLGCVAYEMLAGAPPFTGATAQAVVTRHLTDPPPSLRALRPTVPARVEAAVLRALAKLPADRFMTAQLFADALGPSGEQRGVEVSGPEQPPAARPQTGAPVGARRRTWLAAALVATGLVAAVVVARLPRPHSGAARSPDPSLYVVLPLQHRGGAAPQLLTGDQCERLLYDALSYWEDLRLVDPIRVSDMLARHAGEPLTLERALRDARALGAGRLVWGEVWEVNDTARVDASVYDVLNANVPARRQSIRVAAAGTDLEGVFAELASKLLARRTPVDGDDPRHTRLFAAWQAYDEGRGALGDWNLARADSAFRAAIRLDPAYTAAYLGLARVLGWASADPPAEWRTVAAYAAANRARLGPREATLAEAVDALASGQFTRACDRYRSLIARDSLDFEAWFGLGECHARDRVVVRDRVSPSGWRFRSSYATAVRAYLRALDLAPSFQAALRRTAYWRLPRLLFTQPYFARLGTALGADTLGFISFPALDHDTLAFVPFRARDVVEGKPGTLPATHLAAVERDRSRLRDLTAKWVRAFPASADALEALAQLLEASGELTGTEPERSAGAALRAARRLATARDQRLRLAVADVRLRARLYDFQGARAVADSVLASLPDPTPEDANALAGLAALTGRAHLAARLLRRAAPVDSIGSPMWEVQLLVTAPPALKEAAEALLAYAALGGPRDSVIALTRSVERLAQSWVEPKERVRVRDALLAEPAVLAFPEIGPTGLHRAHAREDPRLRAQLALATGDSGAARAALRELGAYAGAARAADIAARAAYLQAWLLLAVGDSTLARDRLDALLNALPRLSSPFASSVPDAAAVARAVILRAELAARAGDMATARRWAAAAVSLWSGADPELRGRVDRLRRLAAPAR